MSVQDNDSLPNIKKQLGQMRGHIDHKMEKSVMERWKLSVESRLFNEDAQNPKFTEV